MDELYEAICEAEAAILAALPWRVRAAGLPSATSIVCVKAGYDEKVGVTLAILAVHDREGLVAGRGSPYPEVEARSLAFRDAFLRLDAGHLDLNLLGEIDSLGDDDYYPYVEDFSFRFDPDGASAVFTAHPGVLESEAHGTLPEGPAPDLEAMLARLDAAKIALASAVEQHERETIERYSAALRERFPTATSVLCYPMASDCYLRCEVWVEQVLDGDEVLAETHDLWSEDRTGRDLAYIEELADYGPTYRHSQEITLLPEQPPTTDPG